VYYKWGPVHDGKTLTFTIPSSNYLSCWASKPACLAAAFMTQPGKYEVSVINDNGESNKLIFTVVSPQINMTAPISVYKTKADYKNLVSVVLSDDKTKIVAYPGPSDAKHEFPVLLNSDYLIGSMPGSGNINGAFLSLDIKKYSEMPEFSFTTNQLYQLIVDKNPFLEIYNCGNSTTQAKMVVDINKWIDSNQLAIMCSKTL